MEPQRIISTARKVFAPFETENVIHYARNFSFQTAVENPLVMLIFLLVLVMGVIKKSKTILLTLFTSIALIFLMHYTLPADPGADLSMKSTLPFAFGGLAIGAALIYFMFIKGD